MNVITPPQRPPFPGDRELRLALKWSTIGHGILMFLILVKGFVFRGKPLHYIPTLKVDLVALPDVLKKDLAHTQQFNQEITEVIKKAEREAKRAKNSKSTQEPAKPDEMVIKPSGSDKILSNKNRNALERMKALAKIQDFATEENPNLAKPTLIKGNKLSPGTSLSGDAREASESSYLDILRDRLQDNWALPTWISRQDLSAQVRILIDSRGKLRGFKFVKLSGNSQFDDAVKRTVETSQPFPFPPKEIQSLLMADGILIGFPL